MKKINFGAVIAFYILVTAVFGGGESGNGGRAVVITRYGKVFAVYLTDIWDALQPKFSPEQDENKYVPYQLLDVSDYSIWQRLYEDRRDEFLKKIRTGGEAGKRFSELFLRSEREMSLYKRAYKKVCPIRNDVLSKKLRPRLDWFQAIYTHTPTPEDPSKTMCISKLFKKYATRLNKAAAEFHEVAYLGAAIELKHSTSDATQELVSIVFERNFKNLSSIQLEKFLKHFMNGEEFPEENVALNTLIGSNSGLKDELLTRVLYSPSIGRPWGVTEALKLPYSEYLKYSPPYATTDVGPDEDLKFLEPKDYTCDYGFTVRKENFNRVGLGYEVQVYVLPPGKNGYQYGPGNQWFEETGPSPYALFTFIKPEDPFVQKAIPQFVLLHKNQKQILWSFGGLTGTCKKTN